MAEPNPPQADVVGILSATSTVKRKGVTIANSLLRRAARNRTALRNVDPRASYTNASVLDNKKKRQITSNDSPRYVTVIMVAARLPKSATAAMEIGGLAP